MKYFIANWKANKNLKDALQWVKVFLDEPIINNQIKIIICPPYPFLYPLADKFKNLANIFLGVQNLSEFDNGNFTGEVTAAMVKDIVNFALIGHSERRKYFLENEEQIEKKIIQAKRNQIEPILCVRGENDKIHPLVKIIAYEPDYAIGTGFNESPTKVITLKKKLNLKPKTLFLYGGSINEINAQQYLKYKEIDGLLVGNCSLDPYKFKQIVQSSLI